MQQFSISPHKLPEDDGIQQNLLQFISNFDIKLIIKLFLFSLISLVLIPTLSRAQDLTYDFDTNRVNITYDSLNRILTKNSSTTSANYTYDGSYQGTLTNISFDNSTYKYEYDNKLRLTNETKIIDGVTFQRYIYYDSMDRIGNQTFTPGTNINYTYNNQSKISAVFGLISSVFHNEFDNPVNRSYNNTRLTEYLYDNKGRITQIKTSTLQHMNYTYDAVGNVLTINDSVNNRLYRISYDFLDRLINTTIGGISYVYSYNEIGNILKIVRDNTNTTKFSYGTNPVHAPSRITTGGVGADVHKLKELYSNAKQRVIDFFLPNEKNVTISNANWTIDFENNNKINSSIAFNISTNDTIWVIAAYNYSNGGSYPINTTGRSANTSIDYENVSVKFGVVIQNLTISNRNTSNITFALGILNKMNVTSQNIQWSCTGGLSGGPFTLTANTSRIDLMSSNYSTPGMKTFSCTTTSVDGNDTKAVEFEISGLKIEDYNNTRLAENQRMINFTIKNYWLPSTVTWYITSDGQTFTNTTSSIGTNATSLVSQTINYTTDGSKDIYINISSGGVVDYYNETLRLEAIEIEDYDTVNITSTDMLLGFKVRNNWHLNRSISWNLTDPSITSNNSVNIGTDEITFILIENNYTSAGTKNPKVTVHNGTFLDWFTDRFMIE